MSPNLRRHARTSCATLALLTVPLGVPRPGHGQCPPGYLVLDHRVIRTQPADNLWDVLQRHVSGRWLRIWSSAPDKQPLIVLDDVHLLGGVERLGEIVLESVDRVTVLRPLDAVARYGGKASNGAIVVVTKAGGRMTRGCG